jgi:hypothetical protein
MNCTIKFEYPFFKKKQVTMRNSIQFFENDDAMRLKETGPDTFLKFYATPLVFSRILGNEDILAKLTERIGIILKHRAEARFRLNVVARIHRLKPV